MGPFRPADGIGLLLSVGYHVEVMGMNRLLPVVATVVCALVRR